MKVDIIVLFKRTTNGDRFYSEQSVNIPDDTLPKDQFRVAKDKRYSKWHKDNKDNDDRFGGLLGIYKILPGTN